MVKRKALPRWLVFSSFLVYLLFLVYMLLFSELMGRQLSGAETGDTLSYNFVLFREIKRFWRYRQQLGFWAVFVNLAGNVLAFIPLGIYLPALWKRCRHFLLMLVMAALFSVVIETLQLYYGVGSFDVDDIFLNTVGGGVGYLLYCVFRR